MATCPPSLNATTPPILNKSMNSSSSKPNYARRANQLLTLGSLRQLIRRHIPARWFLVISLALLASLSLTMYFITNNAFGSYRELHLDAAPGTWFILTLYLSAIPLAS